MTNFATNSKPIYLSIGCLSLPELASSPTYYSADEISSCIMQFYIAYFGLINATRTSALLQNFCMLKFFWRSAYVVLSWFGRGFVCFDRHHTVEPLTWRDCKGRNLPAARVSEANFERESPAQLSRSDPLIRGYLDKATLFSSADSCARTAMMPLRNGTGRNRPAERVWEADFECEHPAQLSRSLMRRQGPKSPHRASLRSLFWMWASSLAQQERPLDLRISRQIHGLSVRRLSLVHSDQQDAPERRQGLVSFCCAILRSSFWISLETIQHIDHDYNFITLRESIQEISPL